jgi:hypothetical protein
MRNINFKSLMDSFIKRAVCLLLFAGISFYGFAQTAFVPGNITFPIIPGERAARFSVAVGTAANDNIEVWVFYSKVQSELNTLNSSSFGSTKHYGKAVMLRSGSTVHCTFVFPHPHHAATPNADLFANMTGTTGLITSGYPAPNVMAGVVIPGMFGAAQPAVKIDFNPVTINKGECVFFRVYKRIRSGSSFTDQVSEIKKFRMPDSFNIGIAGDSYGAGEGAPADEFELSGNNNDMWLSCPCHRSKKSGLLRGVKKFIARFPETAVDYSFQACSGAVVEHFYSSRQTTSTHAPGTRIYEDDCGGPRVDIQFEKIRKDLITDRKHDAIQMLLMSGGGNNSGFGDVVVYYLIGPLNLAALNAAGNLVNQDVLAEYTERINGLTNNYAGLDNGINEFFTEVRPIIGITNYPDPTKGVNGRCGASSPLGPDYPCARYETGFATSPKGEYDIIHDRFIVPLNNQVRATSSLGWNVIDIENEAGRNGICNCDEAYVNSIGASYAVQGDIYGTVHPNDEGYREMYKDKVYDFVRIKYDTYKGSYTVGIAFGLVQSPAPCENNFIRLDTLVLLAKMKELSPVISTFSGFSGLKTDLSSINLEKEDIKAPEINTGFSKIQATQYKTASTSIPLKSSIVKQNFTLRPVTAIKPPGPAMLKVRSDLNSYVQSAEYKSKLVQIRTQKVPAKTKSPEPLDNLFNN